ncbi:MAG: hypothetical protein K2J48_04300 [Muribaculaceae bacterium]|nr:hypothetical protein [Muribaculaceae bacterium]
MAITNKVGPPVTGEDFFGRKEELSRAHAYLNTNHSLTLSAPRRIGKSSFAKRLIEDKTKEGWNCVYVDLEGIRTKDDFLKILLTKFDKSGIWTEASKAAGGVINRLLEGIKGIGPLNMDFSHYENSPKNYYNLLGNVINHDQHTLIVIDELTLFLGVLDKNDPTHEEVAFFLNWFRSLRQVLDSKIRWIFCGSVGLHNFTRSRNLSLTINDLLSFDFDALSYEEAFGLVKALAASENIPITDEIVEYLLKQLEWYIPYFIQLLFTNLKSYASKENGVTEALIDSVMDSLVRIKDFSSWSERLSEYNGQEIGARLLLKELCKAENGFSREQLLTVYTYYLPHSPLEAENELSLILSMMEHDGYIMRTEGGKRRFRSPLLRKWWYYNFVE